MRPWKHALPLQIADIVNAYDITRCIPDQIVTCDEWLAQDHRVSVVRLALPDHRDDRAVGVENRTEAVAGKDVPALYFGTTKMNNNCGAFDLGLAYGYIFTSIRVLSSEVIAKALRARRPAVADTTLW
jgi:hypothetical protein